MRSLEDIASTLRFADGDLVIKLSDDTKLDLFISKDVVKKACLALAPLLRSRGDPGYSESFARGVDTTLPGKSQPVNVTTLALKFVPEDKTLVLEGDEFQGVTWDSPPFWPFNHSDLASPDWAEITSRRGLYPYMAHEEAALEHMVIFKILHGIQFSIKDICPYPSYMDNCVQLVCQICARAEYMGCLPQVAKSLRDKLSGCRHFWAFVARYPRTSLLLAEKMRSKEMYFDAIRHIVADPNQFEWDFLTKHLGTPVKALTDLTTILQEQTQTINKLHNDLQLLQLFPVKSVAYGGAKQESHVTLFNKLRVYVEGETDQQKESMNAEYFARAHWGEFFTQQTLGQRVRIVDSGKARGETAGPLSRALADIDDHVAAGRPAWVFGKGAAGKIVHRFSLSNSIVNKIHFHLCNIVCEADRIAKTAFVTKEVIDSNGQTITYRRARHDANEDYWTYLPWDESTVPWKEDDEEWAAAPIDTSGLNTTPATNAQLLAVGIDVNGVTPATNPSSFSTSSTTTS